MKRKRFMRPSASRPSRRTFLRLLGGAVVCSMPGACYGPSAGSSRPVRIDEKSELLLYSGLLEVAKLIESGVLSPVELTEMQLERIFRLDPKLRSYATLMADQARESARRAHQEIQAGNYRGPLHGIPLAAKDLCFTRGVRTMGGMAVHKNFVPQTDATVVRRLEQAGAVMLGKLNMTEGAMAGYHKDFDIPVNPWGDQLWVGASSSGSGVATASGLCFAALGSDTGGSIRFPAMANGIVGLKPTYGRVSRYGILPLAESMDHIGPLTRRVADAAVVLQAISGADPLDQTALQDPVPDFLAEIHAGVGSLRIGYDPHFGSQGVEPSLVKAVEQALEVLQNLGAQVVNVQVPEWNEDLQSAWFSICAFEVHAAHVETFPSRAGEYGPYLREILQKGSQVSSSMYQQAGQLRIAYNRQFEDLLEGVDALLSPGGGVPFSFPPELQYQGTAELDPAVVSKVYTQFTFPSDFSGVPALSLPCGISPTGVPYSMQVTGRRLSEALLCRIGQAYEEATAWHVQHPPI